MAPRPSPVVSPPRPVSPRIPEPADVDQGDTWARIVDRSAARAPDLAEVAFKTAARDLGLPAAPPLVWVEPLPWSSAFREPAGMIFWKPRAEGLMQDGRVYLLGALSPRKAVEVAFHEARHLWQYHVTQAGYFAGGLLAGRHAQEPPWGDWTRDALEVDAQAYAELACHRRFSALYSTL